MKNKKTLWMILTGLVVGAISVGLVLAGNPKNMGFCIACFVRDIAGGVGMHQAAIVQYIRPEIIGLVLGALIMSVAGKEFRAQGGSSPMTRFVLGFFVMVGALMFLGCPLRMALRISGGILCLNQGFSLRRTYAQSPLEGGMISAVNVALLVLVVAAPPVIFFSAEGPGSMRAPIWLALAAGLIVGALAQKTRLCMVGGLRDAVLFQDFYLLYGFIAIIVAAAIGNLITGNFNLGFAGQPVAHSDALWNFMGMVLVGFASVLLGGCPLRQLILAGSGNSDSAVTVLGMFVGAACCHNFKLASSADGPTPNGKIAVILGLAVVAAIAELNIQKQKSNK